MMIPELESQVFNYTNNKFLALPTYMMCFLFALMQHSDYNTSEVEFWMKCKYLQSRCFHPGCFLQVPIIVGENYNLTLK